MGGFVALATDLDGTLTSGGLVHPGLLEELARARDRGIRILLVTGRVLADLAADHRGLAGRFDLVVAENGAVLTDGRHVQELATPVDAGLADDLERQGVPVHRGRVLLACHGRDEARVAAAVRDSGHQLQLIRNRDALMVLPAGVDKGSGVVEALRRLGIPPRRAIGVGDAENDRGLLAACGLGVATADAVPALKARADLVLDQQNGRGVGELLTGELLAGAG